MVWDEGDSKVWDGGDRKFWDGGDRKVCGEALRMICEESVCPECRDIRREVMFSPTQLGSNIIYNTKQCCIKDR